MRKARILFVDDEPKIVLTMPHILRQQGHQVTASDSVNDALNHISSTPFDVLISDLNLAEQDDGMIVVRAMRRTQPECLVFILTGFPAESVLQTIRDQADEYVVKPAPVSALLDLIERRLDERRRGRASASERVHEVLRENLFEITQRALRLMRADVRLEALAISDDQRIEHAPHVVGELAAVLEAADSQEIEKGILRDAELHGVRQYKLGYTIPLLAAYMRHLERAILDTVHEHLPLLDPVFFMFDLKRLDACLGLELEYTLKGYLDAEEQGGRLPAQRSLA